MTLIKILFWIAYFISLYFLIFWFTYYFSRRDQIKEELNDNSDLKFYPTVSVIVPAYNEEKTIVGTLKSLAELDYPKDKLELLVINDGSKDKTEKIVLDYIKKNNYHHIKYFYQDNAGKAHALNKGLNILKGEYFACLDADSFVDKHALKRMLKMHIKDKELAVVTPILQVNNPKNWIQKFQRIEYLTSMVVIKLMSFLDCNFVAPGKISNQNYHSVLP
ncbi:glycosyltransferase family 2 protein [Bacteroidota bacterium]